MGVAWAAHLQGLGSWVYGAGREFQEEGGSVEGGGWGTLGPWGPTAEGYIFSLLYWREGVGLGEKGRVTQTYLSTIAWTTVVDACHPWALEILRQEDVNYLLHQFNSDGDHYCNDTMLVGRSALIKFNVKANTTRFLLHCGYGELYSQVRESHYTPAGRCTVGSTSKPCLSPVSFTCPSHTGPFWASVLSGIPSPSSSPSHIYVLLFSRGQTSSVSSGRLLSKLHMLIPWGVQESLRLAPTPTCAQHLPDQPRQHRASCMSNGMFVWLLLEHWGLQQCVPSHHGGWEVSSSPSPTAPAHNCPAPSTLKWKHNPARVISRTGGIGTVLKSYPAKPHDRVGFLSFSTEFYCCCFLHTYYRFRLKPSLNHLNILFEMFK